MRVGHRSPRAPGDAELLTALRGDRACAGRLYARTRPTPDQRALLPALRDGNVVVGGLKIDSQSVGSSGSSRKLVSWLLFSRSSVAQRFCFFLFAPLRFGSLISRTRIFSFMIVSLLDFFPFL